MTSYGGQVGFELRKLRGALAERGPIVRNPARLACRPDLEAAESFAGVQLLRGVSRLSTVPCMQRVALREKVPHSRLLASD